MSLYGLKFQQFVRMFSAKHLEAHRRQGYFSEKYDGVFGRYVEFFLGYLYGNVPELDRTVHVRLHHRENGGGASRPRHIRSGLAKIRSRYLDCRIYSWSSRPPYSKVFDQRCVTIRYVTSGRKSTIDANDPRLRAADLSESEFVGTLDLHPDNNADQLLYAYRSEFLSWAHFPVQPFLEPHAGYVLRYNPSPQPAPLVFLGFEDNLVGIFEHDTLAIDQSHRGKHLSGELILAGFAQTPWKPRSATIDGRIAPRKLTAAIRARSKGAWVVLGECVVDFAQRFRYEAARA
jgi:hypothetical protein